MTRLKFEHVNFSSLDVSYRVDNRDVSIPPNCILVAQHKNGKPRIIPMNEAVPSTLQELVEGAEGDDFVFRSLEMG